MILNNIIIKEVSIYYIITDVDFYLVHYYYSRFFRKIMKDLNGETPLAHLIEGGNKNEIQIPLICVSLGDEGDIREVLLYNH
jgi:hypothetical protein